MKDRKPQLNHGLCSCMMLQFVCYLGLIIHCVIDLTEMG